MMEDQIITPKITPISKDLDTLIYIRSKSQSNETLSFAFDAIGILEPLLCTLHGVPRDEVLRKHVNENQRQAAGVDSRIRTEWHQEYPRRLENVAKEENEKVIRLANEIN